MKTKPVPATRTALDYSECAKFIEEKHGIKLRDYARSHEQFGEWCKAKGEEPTQSPEDSSNGTAQAQYARYTADVASGAVVERPYQDLWHFLVDTFGLNNGSEFELYEGIGDDAEQWQKDIIQLFVSEFGRGPYRAE